MLSRIIIENFKSIRNKTTIELTKTNYSSLLDTNVAGNGILKGALFVGANASGKSNIIQAIKLLLDLLFKEKEINAGLSLCLFSESNEFVIEYVFNIEGKEILYRIKNNPFKNVLCEEVFLDGKLLLDRMGLTAKSYLGDGKEFVFDENELDKETLFLRTLFFNTRFAGNDVLRKWFEYLQNSICFNASDRSVISYGKEDLSINSYLKENGTAGINDFFTKHNFEQTIDYTNERKTDKLTMETIKDDEKRLFLKRKGLNVPIPFSEESLGNRTLLNMMPSFLSVVNNSGMLLIDEFSSGFHNELEELLIKYFMKNSRQSQIIFVSHSTNLLSNSILRPDQIYSVKFDGEKGSSVKRFSDEQPRVAQNLEKMYLSGIFDGLPEYNNAVK